MPLIPVTNSGDAGQMDQANDGLVWGSGYSPPGPVFRNATEKRTRQSQFGYYIWSRLIRVLDERPELFPDKRVNILMDYSTRRTFRRGATTQAEILDLSETVTNLNNRWQSVEKAKGKRKNHSSMRSYNSGIRLMLEALLKFSIAMWPGITFWLGNSNYDEGRETKARDGDPRGEVCQSLVNMECRGYRQDWWTFRGPTNTRCR